MATRLYLDSTTNSGIGNYFDMVVTTTSGGVTVAEVATQGSGTEIQWTDTSGGNTIGWISGRVPSGGFTLTSASMNIYAYQSSMLANCGARCRLYKYGGAELGGGPFDDGVEFGLSYSNYNWTCNVTDTAFAENDRILLILSITNIGTMGGGDSCFLKHGETPLVPGAGDSYCEIAETVTFKAEGGGSLPPRDPLRPFQHLLIR